MTGSYVVSAGIEEIIKDWCARNSFKVPTENFFKKMTSRLEEQLKKIFERVEIISYKTISSGIEKIVLESNLIPVSLDRVYYKTEFNLDVTRKMSPEKNSYIVGERFGCSSVENQINNIKERGVKKNVILIDDVGFSGGTIVSIIEKLKEDGIVVDKVCLGIGIENGIKFIKKKTSVRVECVIVYKKVKDQICSWDFYPGIPLSGRLIDGSDNIGMSYCAPFGDIVSWASIPRECSHVFSQFLIKESVRLFEEIERKTNRLIFCKDLDRKVYGLPVDNTRIVDALKSYIIWILFQKSEFSIIHFFL